MKSQNLTEKACPRFSSMEAAYCKTTSAVCKDLKVDPDKGLSQSEAESRLLKYGRNGSFI